jgi:hypothetical protein
MKAMNYLKNGIVFLTCFFIFDKTANAQFEFDLQLIQRSEYRHGYGQLIPEGADPAAFFSHRARLQFKYKWEKLTLYASIQDVRTFGNTSQVKLNDPFLSLHEGWAEVHLDSSWSLKIGRQELNYDNARFLGNLDWALQARAHDFILIKYEKDKFKLHVGGGYNQDGEKLSGNLYTTPNQYKTAQMARAEYKWNDFDFSFLFWNNGRQYTVKDTLDNITDKGMRYMQTIGLPTMKYQISNTTISGFYYHQFGNDINNKDVNAFDASIQASQLFKFSESRKNQFRITLGAEVLSGTDNNNTTNDNFSFAPLYGTNHAHNGYMDLFYVGGRHENSVGLYDAFIRLKYDVNSKVFLSLNGHYFNSFADVYSAGKKLDKYLGTELDFTIGYVPFKAFSIQAGYSQLFASTSLETLQKVIAPRTAQNWAYLMLIYRPKMDKKFIGLVF